MRQIGVAVIGLGEMGQGHLNAYAQLANVHLVGVYDVNQVQAQAVAEKFAVHAFPDLETLLADTAIDAVSICTPDGLHFSSVMQALHARKHILLEKPLTVDPDEGWQLVQRAADVPVVFMVGHTLRFDPRYYLAQQEIAQGNIGEIVHLYARRNNLVTNAQRLGGRTSVAMFLGVHDLDVMTWLAASEVESVSAAAATKRLASLGVADTIMATLRFASGAVGALEVSWVMPEQFVAEIDARLEIMGTNGALYVNIHDQGLRVFKGGRLSYPDTSYGTWLNGRFTGILREEITEFICAITEERPSPVPAFDGYRAVCIARAIEEAVQRNEVVHLSEIMRQ